MNMKVHSRKNILIFCSVVGSFLIHLSLGAAYSHGDISTYLSRLNHSYLVYPFGMFGLSSSMGFGGYLAHRLGPRIPVFIGTFIMNTGVMLTTVASSYSFLTYGFICGVGAGLLFSVCLEVTCQGFHKYIGSILGVILSGFTLGPVFLHFLIDFIPKTRHDYYPSFLYFGIAFFLLQLIGLLLLQNANVYQNEEEQHLFPINIIDEIPTHNMILEIDFWIIWLIFALNSYGTIFLLNLQSPGSITFLNWTISTIYTNGFFSFCGRIIWGCLSDYISMKAIFCTMSLGSCLGYAMYILILNGVYTITISNISKIMTSVMCIWLSGNSSIIFGLIIKRFGKKNLAANIGCIMTAYCISGIIASLLSKKMLNNDIITFSAIVIMSFLSFLLTLFYNGKPRQYTINIADIFSCFRQ